MKDENYRKQAASDKNVRFNQTFKIGKLSASVNSFFKRAIM